MNCREVTSVEISKVLGHLVRNLSLSGKDWEMKDHDHTKQLNSSKFSSFKGLIAAVGSEVNKLTTPMKALFEFFPQAQKVGVASCEEGTRLLTSGAVDALFMPALHPWYAQLQSRFGLLTAVNVKRPPFVYGQFGRGEPSTIVIDELSVFGAYVDFALPHCCPIETVCTDGEAPRRAFKLHAGSDRPVGFVAPEFVACHAASDQIQHRVGQCKFITYGLFQKV